MAEPYAAWKQLEPQGPGETPLGTKGRGPEGGCARCRAEGLLGYGGPALGVRSPRLQSLVCQVTCHPVSPGPPTSGAPMLVGGLGLLSGRLARRTHPPTVSGKISWPSCLLPTGESRLLRPILCPHITGGRSPGWVPVAVGSRVAEAVHILVEGGGHAIGFEHAEEGVSSSAQQQADQLIIP